MKPFNVNEIGVFRIVQTCWKIQDHSLGAIPVAIHIVPPLVSSLAYRLSSSVLADVHVKRDGPKVLC